MSQARTAHMPLLEKTDAHLTIGQLAQRCNLTVRTLRYYEELDLIQAVGRTAGGYRLYDEHSERRVSAIQALQSLGYALEEIAAMIGAASMQPVHSKTALISNTRQNLKQQQAQLGEKLDQLLALQEKVNTRLEALEAFCAPCDKAHPNEDVSRCEQCAHGEIHWH